MGVAVPCAERPTGLATEEEVQEQGVGGVFAASIAGHDLGGLIDLGLFVDPDQLGQIVAEEPKGDAMLLAEAFLGS